VHIIQVVPRLPPMVDGIGDYAAVLGRSLESLKIRVSYLSCDPRQSDIDVGLTGITLGTRDAQNFSSCLRRVVGGSSEPATVLIHFAPYGYHDRGCPLWLLKGLEAVRNESNISITVIYHELDTRNRKPWSSAFWVPPFQRYIIDGLRKLSTTDVTNTHEHLTRLGRRSEKQVKLMSNFSTVGEPDSVPNFLDRRPSLVIFGRAWQRGISYRTSKDAIRTACNILGAQEIIDIGDPIAGLPPDIDGLPIIQRGRLASFEVSNILRESRGLYLSYPVTLLGKSSVFAAACAHGAVPLVHNERGEDRNPSFVEGMDYLLIGSGTSPVDVDLSALVFSRYQNRNSRRAADWMVRTTDSLISPRKWAI